MKHFPVWHLFILVILFLPQTTVAAGTAATGTQAEEEVTTRQQKRNKSQEWHWEDWEKGVVAYVFAVLGAAGVASNGLAVLALLCTSGRGDSAMFATNLAFVDTVLCGMLLGASTAAASSQAMSPSSGKKECFAWLQGMLMFTTCSIYTVTAISAHRYLGVLHPLRRHTMVTSNGSLKVLLGVWVLSFLLLLPMWSSLLFEHDPAHQAHKRCSVPYPLWYLVTLSVFVFLLPLCVINQAYCRVRSRLADRSLMMARGAAVTVQAADNAAPQPLRIHVVSKVSQSAARRQEARSGSVQREKAAEVRSQGYGSQRKMSVLRLSGLTNVTSGGTHKASCSDTSTTPRSPASLSHAQDNVLKEQGPPYPNVNSDARPASQRPQSSPGRIPTTRIQPPDGFSRTSQRGFTLSSLGSRLTTLDIFSPSADQRPRVDRHRFHCRTRVILLLIQLSFLVFWLPFFVMMLLCHLSGLGQVTWLSPPWCITSQLWALTHSFVNPFLYIWMQGRYRHTLCALLHCRLRRSDRVHVQHSNFVPRAAGVPNTH